MTITEFSGSSGLRTYSGTLSQSKMYWCSSLEDSYIVIIIIIVVVIIIIVVVIIIIIIIIIK